MKKILFLMASLFIAANTSFASETEIFENSKGKNIVVKEDKTWEYAEEFNRKKEFEKIIKIEDLAIERKNNQKRAVSFKVRNYSRNDLEFVTYKVKFLLGDEYSLRKIINVRDVKKGQSVEIRKFVSVEDISGRDMKIDVLDYKFRK